MAKAKELIGGQAVIEGVMMRNKNKVAIATANKGKVKVKKETFKSVGDKYKFLKWPFLRGTVNLIEMLVIGIKALTYSADQAAEEDGEEMKTWEIATAIGLAVVFSILIFIGLPFLLAGFVSSDRGIFFNIIDGLIRVVIFFIYILAISMMKDIKRVFEYHGAEHAVVHCNEHKKKLTPENAAKYSTLHPRCGTSFMIIVLVVSIVVFSLIVSDHWYVKLIGRIVLIPVVAGISYEVLRAGARYEHSRFFKILTYPGMLTQKITTKKPDKKQLKIAIAALKGVL